MMQLGTVPTVSTLKDTMEYFEILFYNFVNVEAAKVFSVLTRSFSGM